MRSLFLRIAASLSFATCISGLLACGGGGNDDPSDPAPAFKVAWTSPAVDLLADLSIFSVPPQTLLAFTDQTLRQTMTVAAAGTRVRVKLSNLHGTSATTIAKAMVAPATSAATITAASSVAATFKGAASVTIPAGSEVWSDPIALSVAANSVLAVDLYFRERAPVGTGLVFFRGGVIASGDQVGAPTLANTATAPNRYFLTEVDTESTRIQKVVVAFGDSITFGQGSPSGGYPTALQTRFNATSAAGTISVVNEGIGGNRLLRDRIGPSGMSRFDREVLGISGATHTIVMLGLNDIQMDFLAPTEKATAPEIINAMTTLVARAKAANLKVYIGTITPWLGATFYSEEREAERVAVNTWIRSNAAVDGIIDFDKALQHPTNPKALDPLFDSGDHVHPSQAGYQKMADSIDLTLF